VRCIGSIGVWRRDFEQERLGSSVQCALCRCTAQLQRKYQRENTLLFVLDHQDGAQFARFFVEPQPVFDVLPAHPIREVMHHIAGVNIGKTPFTVAQPGKFQHAQQVSPHERLPLDSHIQFPLSRFRHKSTMQPDTKT
jgi:hypothetical protein